MSNNILTFPSSPEVVSIHSLQYKRRGAFQETLLQQENTKLACFQMACYKQTMEKEFTMSVYIEGGISMDFTDITLPLLSPIAP